MKTKLRLLLMAVLLSVSFAHAQKTDVWDFGATQLTGKYNNKLSIATLNALLGTSGTNGNTLGNTTFTTDTLKWVGSGDRLRTTNTALTRYDENVASVPDATTYRGRLYSNGIPGLTAGLASTKYLAMTLLEDDEVTIIARCDAGTGTLNFALASNYLLQKDSYPITSVSGETTVVKFAAKTAGEYRIFDVTQKASFYRISRAHANYKTISGTFDETAAPGISGYSVVFTNPSGKKWTVPVTAGAYSITVPAGYTYQLSLANANGYVISNGDTLAVTDTTTSYNGTLLKVDLFTVSGTISGLADVSKLSGLTYTPDPSANKIYAPKPVITGSNYTVQLEPNVQYTISGQGVNDYNIPANTITITNTATSNIAFTAKPVYPITINTTGLNATQLGKLGLTFTNMNESGYVYNFASTSGITLRDGTYSVTSSGIENYPVDCGTISNLTVNGAAASKTINFKPVKIWSFDDKTISTTTLAGYKGMLLTGTVSNRIANGDLTAKTGATIKIPVTNIGDKVLITYYYAANFSIEGGTAITTASNSTSIFENVEYTVTGTEANPGYVTITLGGSALTSYFTNIQIGGGTTAYSPVITVGPGKDYQTINAALTVAGFMNRNSTQKVTIMIDPGNYEEMIVVNSPNITLKNAASSPSIALQNAGVDIDPNAVRITSYYGVGYNYYSQGTDNKWSADALAVNKENGYTNYTSVSGTTNASYWNATAVINANGFVAENIIFENSFNQYISQKESQDVVIQWTTGGKGVRPTAKGSTAVQNKSFVERAAAIGIPNNIDKVVLNNCRVVGRQDSFFGGTNARVVVYKGVMMGGTDYLFGGMNAVFYKTDLAMNTSEDSNDVSYITAPQQSSGRGYLMYQCKITSAVPGTETGSAYRSKPGYFGRPWQANTSEVVFYNTTIETSDNPNFSGQSLIMPAGWNSSLGGTSPYMYEYGTIEPSGTNNQSSRAAWATKLAVPTLTDGTAINTYNFTKGSDSWDPIPQLISNESLGTKKYQPTIDVTVYSKNNKILFSGIKSETKVAVYSLTGSLVKSAEVNEDSSLTVENGVYIVKLTSAEGQKTAKMIVR